MINSSLSFQVVIGAIFFAPFFEEIIFRKYLLSGLSERISPIKAIIITSILFTIIHINAIQLFSAFVLSLFFSYHFLNYRNIAAVIFLHMMSNLITLLIGHLKLDYPYINLFYEKYYFLLFISGAIVICFLIKKYRKNLLLHL
ncbi:CPBP family intramembrane metalloprotease [Sphingobacteriaceae bacterium WQ 2009]|uniref:CPBP family intramembrane metalloprotease n=1 Tax=Rhinopithecimicrobium faecis TaxID=2820698 RepID=A0A8T4H931_9SPHI|nr:CPBP family intramembrane metalloprotease [Sphingobacteriaceae bacterium WQ 2009]